MKSNIETITLGDKTLIVEYNFEKSDSQIEECHGLHEIGQTIYTELRRVINVATGTDLLPRMAERTQKQIVKRLTHEV